MNNLNQEITDLFDNDELGIELVISYLNIYVGQEDWLQKIKNLYNKRNAKNNMKQLLSCAILLPAQESKSAYMETTTYLDRMGNGYYSQLAEKDWFAALKEAVQKDQEIKNDRMQAWSLGVIDPLEYAPNTRQAYNWLYMKAEETGAVKEDTKQEVQHRFKNLVNAYGGAVICGVFTRHEDVLKRVVNWRSGYFFERCIFDVYSIEQVLKIKKKELETTNSKLVKTVHIKGQ